MTVYRARREQRTMIEFAQDRLRDFDIIEGRKYRHVAEWLGSREDGQLTARWSQDMTTGTWFMSEGWKRPNLRHRLDAKSVAVIESLISDAPVTR